MRITVPEHFEAAAMLTGGNVNKDPRQAGFADDRVDIDLRQCTFVRPAAALWCAVYPLLARRTNARVRLLVPEQRQSCDYLKSIGLFSILKGAGVEVDDRGILTREHPQVVLPLTHFTTSDEVDRLANLALERLNESGLGSENLRPLVSEVFAELALNAVEHSQSPIGAYGLVQFYRYKEGERFICGVTDGGIGIRRSLETNRALKDRISYDWDAIELATRERISRTGDPSKGIGLYGVAEEMRTPGRRLIIHSGIGSLYISEQTEFQARRVTLFPGTLTFASLPA